MISLCIYPIHGSQGELTVTVCWCRRACLSLFHAPETRPCCFCLWSLFPFISGCLLAGCCLSVVAVGTLGAVHSWSFVLCGVFIMGGGFSQRPSPSVSGTLLFPAEPTFPASTFTSNLFHFFNRLTGVALLLINNYCLVKKGLKKLSTLSFAKPRQSTKVKHFTTLLIR